MGSATLASSFVEVAPDVRVLAVRTPTLLPATHTNLVVVGRDDAVLIEPATPYRDEQDRALSELWALRDAGIRVTSLVVTHHHPDHAGGAARFAAALGLRVRGHEESLRRLDADVPRGAPISDGEEVGTLRAVFTPGHAPGHHAFLEARTGVIVAGDMVAGTGTILIEPNDGDMALYLASLEKLASLEATALIPAHGDVLAPEVIARYIAHRLAREERVHAALVRHDGPATPSELVPDAYSDASAQVWPLAALSTEAHLIKLERDGRARRDASGRWAPVPG